MTHDPALVGLLGAAFVTLAVLALSEEFSVVPGAAAAFASACYVVTRAPG